MGSGSPTKPTTSEQKTGTFPGDWPLPWLFSHWEGTGSPADAIVAPTRRASTENRLVKFRRRCMVSSRRLRAIQSKISSNSRGSYRATATVKRTMASGSMAQRSKPTAFAETPICAHWRQANSRSACRVLSLSSEISIFDSEGAESIHEHHPVTRRWVLGYRPTRRGDEFVVTWMKCPEICFVAAAGLVDRGKELEMNLIHAPGDMDSESLAVVSRHHP